MIINERTLWRNLGQRTRKPQETKQAYCISISDTSDKNEHRNHNEQHAQVIYGNSIADEVRKENKCEGHGMDGTETKESYGKGKHVSKKATTLVGLRLARDKEKWLCRDNQTPGSQPQALEPCGLFTNSGYARHTGTIFCIDLS